MLWQTFELRKLPFCIASNAFVCYTGCTLYLAFAVLYNVPFLLAERVDLPCSYTLFLEVSELSQQKLFFDTALATPEKVLLLVMSMCISYTQANIVVPAKLNSVCLC